MSEIAIAHKDYDVRGGGERVAESLAQTFDCPLYVGIGGEKAHDSDVAVEEIEASPWIRRGISRGGLTRKVGLTLLWRQDATELYDYDTIIMSGAQPRWFKPREDQTIVSYTHSTPRRRTDRWHQREFAGLQSRLGGIVSDCFEVCYQPNLTHPDVFVCNSEIVKRRVMTYWGVPEERVTVVHPPVDTEAFSATAETQDYYFSVSRLHPLKHYDEVIRAFQGTGRNLKIAGRGPCKDYLESLADGHDNIELLGYISEEEKRRRLAEATAFVFNAEQEDFGIAPVEAMAAGTPVIGVNEGFTQHQIVDGANGMTYTRGSIVDAIKRYEWDGVGWTAEEIADFARANFGRDRFETAMKRVVAEQREANQINPEYTYPNQ